MYYVFNNFKIRVNNYMIYFDLIVWIVIYYNIGISDNFVYFVIVIFSLVCDYFFLLNRFGGF